MADKQLQVIPLGGLGEFGMNSLALRYGDDIIVIDAGMMFPDAELLGVDIVTPDFTYLQQNREHVRALLLTHAHEDHIGAVPFLLSDLDIPVYGTPFTLAMVERRLEEHQMLDKVKLNEVKPGDKLDIGPFQVEFIHVTHSTVSAVALAVTTPLGVVIHTGDFKVDPTPTDNVLFDLHTFAEYGKRGVLLLLSDSTNVDRPGYTESERAVRPRFEELFIRSKRKLIISCFSSSVHRLQQILDVAAECGRKVAFLGRSMLTTSEIAHNLGLLHIPDSILLRPQDIMQAPPSKVAVVVSGTQGEPMSALSRVAVDNHKSVSIHPGDTVILSARIIPGNEKGIYRMINHIARRGADIVYGSMNPPVHVSGHGSAEELRLVLNLVRPRFFVPIHGEYRQLYKHALLAGHLSHSGLERTFVLETGETLRIDSAGAEKG
ncbi:MAG: ribonuclease J, partial [Bryobacteraceae bacterium]